jgi:ATP-dependent DNA ligase
LWLKPVLVGQFEFTEWTPEGHLRHSRFMGLREDKKVKDVVREMALELFDRGRASVGSTDREVRS